MPPAPLRRAVALSADGRVYVVLMHQRKVRALVGPARVVERAQAVSVTREAQRAVMAQEGLRSGRQWRRWRKRNRQAFGELVSALAAKVVLEGQSDRMAA